MLWAKVELIKAAERKVGEYSCGMRQRLFGIADLLVKDLSPIIMDEPNLWCGA